jgi:hypothetical protein
MRRRHPGFLRPLVLISVFVVLLSSVFVSAGGAQSTSSSANGDLSGNPEGQSKKIEIDLDRPKDYQRFNSNMTSRPQTEIEFKAGKGRAWSFVKFEKLAEHTSIKVKDKPPGYEDSEELKAGMWYPFKTMLPIVLYIDSQAKMPAELKFQIGYLKDELDFHSELSIDKVRGEAQDIVNPFTSVQTVAFYWVTAGVSFEPASLTFAPADTSKKVTLKGDLAVWIMVRIPVIPPEVQATITATSVDDLTSPLRTQLKPGEWIGFKNSATLELQLDRKQVKPDIKSANLDVETAIDQSSGRTKDAVAADIKADRITSNSKTQLSLAWDQTTRLASWIMGAVLVVVNIGIVALIIIMWRQWRKPRSRDRAARPGMKAYDSAAEKKGGYNGSYDDGDVKGSSSGIKPKPSSASVAPVARTITQTGLTLPHAQPTIQKEELDQLRLELQSQIATLRTDLEAKLHTASQNQTTPDYVKECVSGLQSDISRVTRELNDELDSVRIDVLRLDEDQKALKPDLVTLETRINTKNVDSIKEVETRFKGEVDQLQRMLVEQAFPESYFARTMGMILSKNILELHEGNLERLIGDAVNNFFQADVPRAESLQELRQRAESIIATLKDVLETVFLKKPEVEHEVRVRCGRAEALLTKISDLQSQLQSRKLSLETTLRIPVSAYPGARQTLIEELGRGIRSELDKLADLQNYFEGDLERLITADLIAIVDICDKKVSLPVGSDSEVESLLQQLFLHAGLRPILPSSGEPFGTAEQDLIQMVPGAPGTSMTVAEVVTRGFYYTHRDNETLLRKAGVMVYR